VDLKNYITWKPQRGLEDMIRMVPFVLHILLECSEGVPLEWLIITPLINHRTSHIKPYISAHTLYAQINPITMGKK